MNKLEVDDDGDDDGEFVSLYNRYMHTWGIAQAAELQQLQHHYFSLMVRCGVKHRFMVVGQAWFVYFMPYQQYFSNIMAVLCCMG